MREKFNARQGTAKQAQKEDKTTAKEIAEAFPTITGQEICEEEVSLIQNIQLPEDEESDLTKDVEASERDTNSKCSDFEHVLNIILGEETGTTFPISIQDQEINALLDTGAEKSCMSMDMFARLKLPINVAKVSKLRNASSKDMKMNGMMTVKFKMGNTIFTQEFVVCDDLVRPIIISRDFTVNNFIVIVWTRHGTKKATKEDKLVIEIEEPMRKRTLTMTRKVAISLRNVFDLECKE